MQATDLGRYLLYGKDRDFLANGAPEPVDSLPLPLPAGSPGRADPGRDRAERVGRLARRRRRRRLPALAARRPERVLAAGDGGTLALADLGAAGDRARFAFEPLDGCADYPEAETNVTGAPTRGATAYGEVTGMVDAHMHMMAFEFLGGRVHCGRPWSPYGVADRAAGLPRPRPERHRRGRREHALLRQPGRHPRHARLADPQGLAPPRLAHARADLLQVGRALLARRAADVREPARRQRGALHGLSAQEELLQRDGRRAPAGQAPARAAGLHRRPERRPRQGLVPDRHDAVRRRAA